MGQLDRSKALLIVAALLPTLLCSGCMASLTVRVLEPAVITLPQEVETLAVVDRSAVGNAGEGFLSVLEGIVTGEEIQGDRGGAQRAIDTLVRTLSASPRFNAAAVVATRAQVDSSLFDTTLSQDAAQALCRDVGAQALVSLEFFDSDSETVVETVKREEDDVLIVEHEAERTMEITVTWRVYDATRARFLDQDSNVRYSRSDEVAASSEAEALDGLSDPYGVIEDLGAEAGEDYGRRIAPSYRFETRSYYAADDDRLKAAADFVRAERWADAEALWREVRQDEDPKLQGRAAFNLALAAEVDGRIHEALERIEEARSLLNNGAARSYAARLRARLEEVRRLDDQMGE
jgi:hypothetical protein